MALLKKSKFSRSTQLTDTHDAIQGQSGNATWVSEFKPVARGRRKLMAEALLRLCYNLGLCCAIVGDIAMYIAGKIALPPNLLTIYVAYRPQNLSPEIAILLQTQRTSAFSCGCVDLLLLEKYSRPGSKVFYTARCRNINTAVPFFCVHCLEHCGPESSLDFVHFYGLLLLTIAQTMQRLCCHRRPRVIN
jgi:hypothetical protein